jgi:hypothetical protein
MKSRLVGAIALSLALSQIAVAPAFAQEAAPAYRTAAPQSFTTDDLQRYGLSASDASQVAGLQDQGYDVVVLSPEEAQRYQAGLTNNQWLIIGGLVIVVAIVLAAD